VDKENKLTAIIKLTNETLEILLVSQMQHWEIVVLCVAKLMISKHTNTDNIVLFLILNHNLAVCCTLLIPLECGSHAYKIQLTSGGKGQRFHTLMFQNMTSIHQER